MKELCNIRKIGTNYVLTRDENYLKSEHYPRKSARFASLPFPFSPQQRQTPHHHLFLFLLNPKPTQTFKPPPRTKLIVGRHCSTGTLFTTNIVHPEITIHGAAIVRVGAPLFMPEYYSRRSYCPPPPKIKSFQISSRPQFPSPLISVIIILLDFDHIS